jgi:hypothetical protein
MIFSDSSKSCPLNCPLATMLLVRSDEDNESPERTKRPISKEMRDRPKIISKTRVMGILRRDPLSRRPRWYVGTEISCAEILGDSDETGENLSLRSSRMDLRFVI